MKKVVVAIDSFKGSLSSIEAAEAAARGVTMIYPNCEVVKVPVADGGEGSVVALVSATGGRMVSLKVSDPMGNPVRAYYGILGKALVRNDDCVLPPVAEDASAAEANISGATAVVELASASGLTLIDEKKRNPLYTTTYGTGELIADAIVKGCRNFIIAIGGSATNDAAMGIMSALGVRFLDSEGNELKPVGESLSKVCEIDDSGKLPLLSECTFRIACDVDNPMFGEYGAAYVYAPQKGASDRDVEILDEGLRSFAAVLEKKYGTDFSTLPGGGAAGGVGAGLSAMLGASICSGASLVSEILGLDKIIEGADLVITGEGKVDRQTYRGKLPSRIIASAKKSGVPVVLVCGIVEFENLSVPCFPILRGPLSLEEAMDRRIAGKNLLLMVASVCRMIDMFR